MARGRGSAIGAGVGLLLMLVLLAAMANTAEPSPRRVPQKPPPPKRPRPVPPTDARRLSIHELRELAANVGFVGDAINIAAAVAMAESRGDTGAVGDEAYGYSLGLWQVNLPAHPQYEPQRLFEADYNARAALAISQGGKNWQPWTTYRTGAHKAWL